ncbi:IclR family transcriptional regulator C-terminal domain-containing protein, partial [Streptomyces sp. NPDC059956]
MRFANPWGFRGQCHTKRGAGPGRATRRRRPELRDRQQWSHWRPRELRHQQQRPGEDPADHGGADRREGLAAELRTVRERGYAVDDGEHEPSVRCLGA